MRPNLSGPDLSAPRGGLARAAVALALVGSVVPLAAFKPFSAVRDACPRCAPFADVVRLAEGGELVAHVMAQNLDALVVERFGEYRALQRAEVAAIVWQRNERRNLPSHDQLVLKNGVVLHGTIVRDNRDGYFVIRVGALEHIAWTAQIESVYREGRPRPVQESASREPVLAAPPAASDPDAPDASVTPKLPRRATPSAAPPGGSRQGRRPAAPRDVR
ncbi:MAG: hypothetical protein IPL40_08695 [Proteobacteria bacterium]|nr:hypothetical protein [Pseudomonadota bacterium]